MVASDQRICVVEDDLGLREAIERLLYAAGFTCDAYASAEEMLATSAMTRAACVVSDYRLQGLSGLELLAALRARGVTVPLILITAFDSVALRAQAMREGVAALLTKPFSGTELLAAIQATIDDPRLECARRDDIR